MDVTTYSYTNRYGDTFDIAFFRFKSYDRGRPMLEAMCHEDGEWQLYDDVTREFFAPLTAIDGFHVHADTNNCPDMVEWLCDRGFIRKTGCVYASGWCEYPEIEYDHGWYQSLPSLDQREVLAALEADDVNYVSAEPLARGAFAPGRHHGTGPAIH